MALCRHLAGAVNWRFYSVTHHSIRSLVLVGYQPNDKEQIKVRSIIAANFQTSFASYVYRYTCLACVCNGCGNLKNVCTVVRFHICQHDANKQKMPLR